MNRNESVDQRGDAARDDGTKEAERPVAELVRPEHREEGAREHHALEADVHDPAPLREHAADRRERQRCREGEHRGEERRPRSDVIEVGGARPRREHTERYAEDAGRDRKPARPLDPPRQRPDTGGDGGNARESGPPWRPGGDRRQREQEGETAEERSEERRVGKECRWGGTA